MSRLIFPTEVRFFEWINKSAANMLDRHTTLAQALSDYTNVNRRVAQITEVEHHGDFIVHETMDLLSRTFITPLDRDEIRALIGRMDDVVDYVEGAADALLLYKVEKPIPRPSTWLGCCTRWPSRSRVAVPLIGDKKKLPSVHAYTVEINRLENEADRVLRMGLARLVEERGDWFELFRWKEILQLIEEATDRCEDVADVLGVVIQKNA